MRSQRSTTLLRAAAVLVAMGFAPVPAAGIAAAPYSGAPFLMDEPLGVYPSQAEDSGNTEMIIARFAHTHGADEGQVSAHACDMGDQADKLKCLGRKDRSCMWTRLQTQDPYKRVQESNSYCLPCRLDDQAIPCWNPGAWLNGKQVTDCAMSCNHQERIWQPEYACSDTTGFISQAQCFSRGAQSGSKCMFTAYKDKDDKERGACGPCQLSGSGGWGCPLEGAPGPEDGSKVISCMSQCDTLCAGPPNCPPTMAPPPPPPPPSPGISDTAAASDVMLSAPAPFAGEPTPNPYSIQQAKIEAAKRAGLKIAYPPPPKSYLPLIYYRSPSDMQFTTGPPPISGPEPPSSLVQRSATRSVFRGLRRRGFK